MGVGCAATERLPSGSTFGVGTDIQAVSVEIYTRFRGGGWLNGHRRAAERQYLGSWHRHTGGFELGVGVEISTMGVGIDVYFEVGGLDFGIGI